MDASLAALAIPGNGLLSRLPEQEFLRLRALMESVTLKFQHVVCELHDPIKHVYFPGRGVVSAVTPMRDGSLIEVASIGNEGMIGLTALMEEKAAPTRLVVQVEVDALRMNADVFRSQMNVAGPLRRIVVLYSTAYRFQESQSAACNGLHSIQQRCCRWILMAHDRELKKKFALTHEFLARLLGVRRVSVTLVLKPLQEAGLIENHRGTVRVLDQKLLEAEACECYRVVRDEFDRIFHENQQRSAG
jgi:CRP-like cAMP-binding protein